MLTVLPVLIYVSGKDFRLQDPGHVSVDHNKYVPFTNTPIE